MASALLASRNEPHTWPDPTPYMKNPNPNPNFPFTGGAVFAVSDDSSSRPPPPPRKNFSKTPGGAYVSFSLSNYSKRKQRELRKQLESELEQVRSFTSRIESREIQNPKMSNNSVATTRAAQEELKKMMKRCGQMLSKLMKQKKSGWFNSPVDVVGMGLHDYYQIVKSPMDLGTVKTKLNKGVYASPVEFAVDVRLTFNNALLYNPQGHEVYKLAGQYLRMFEGMFGPAYAKYEQQLSLMSVEGDEHARNKNLFQPSVSMVDSTVRSEFCGHLPKAPTPPPVSISSPLQAMSSVQARQQPYVQSSKSQFELQQHSTTPVGRMVAGKQPKPRAKDLNKRQMSYEEKQKLGYALESLPHDKMTQVLQIVSKRNGQPMQDGDEIELDIEMIDTQTLWELDRFVNNCKKMMSKIRRQEEARASIGHSPGQIAEAGNRSPVPVDTPEAVAAKRSRKLDTGEEDVDIGDEMPPAHYPSVEIQKNAVDADSSSSSDSDSSSDDSGSDSSSGSDSDEND